MTLKEKFKKELPWMISPKTGLPFVCPGYYNATAGLHDNRTIINCEKKNNKSYTCEKCWNREYKGDDENVR